MPQWKELYGEDHILYIDESGINTNETAEYGWSPRGERCHALKSGGHGTRLTMISAVRSSSPFKFVTPLIFQGSCDRKIFTTWLEYLLKSLQLSSTNNQKKHLIILDNASIHKGREIDQLVAQYHVRIAYLPTYSPDFNPIERAWSVLKRKVCYLVDPQKVSIPNALEIVFKKMQ